MKQITLASIPCASSSKDFSRFGRLISDVDISASIDIISRQEMPTEGNIYEDSIKELAATSEFRVFRRVFGEVEIKAGYCIGRRSTLNALEYHKSSEIILAASDLVLFLGSPADLDDRGFDSSKVDAFRINMGEIVELHPMVLHFAPCSVCAEGFRSGIVLPKETNNDLAPDAVIGYLFKKNKWLLAHDTADWLLAGGAVVGLRGDNLEVVGSV